MSLNFARDYATGVVTLDGIQSSLSKDHDCYNIISEMETIKNNHTGIDNRFQWLKANIKFHLHDKGARELHCNVANLIPFMSLFDMILQLFSHNFLTMTNDTKEFASQHDHFLAPGDRTDKMVYAQQLLNQGTKQCALALLTNNLFAIDVAGQKLETFTIMRQQAGKPSPSEIENAIQASLDKINNIIKPDEYAKWYHDNVPCSWFCDLGIEVFPNDKNYILAPKATPAASKKFRTSMIVNEPQQGQENLNVDEGNLSSQSTPATLSDTFEDGTDPETNVDTALELPELDLFASGNCVKAGIGNEYDVFLHPIPSSKHMGHVPIEFNEGTHNPKRGSCLMSHQVYITQARDIIGYNEGTHALRSLPGLLRGLLQDPTLTKPMVSLKKECELALEKVSFHEYRREIKVNGAYSLRLEGMWLLEPVRHDFLSDHPDVVSNLPWTNNNFALNWDKLFETTVCYAEKEKTLNAFLDTMDLSKKILQKVLKQPTMHELSGQLKTLAVFAAELISYLPGSAKGGIQYPGPLMKIMRSRGVLGPTEPLHIVGSKETDIVNLTLFPLMPKPEQEMIGLKNGMNPELLCLPGATVEKILALLLHLPPITTVNYGIHTSQQQTCWMEDTLVLFNSCKNGTGFGSNYFAGTAQSRMERNLLALSSLVGSIITAGHDEPQSQQIMVFTDVKALRNKDVSEDNKIFLLLARVIVFSYYLQYGFDIKRKNKLSKEGKNLVINGLAPYRSEFVVAQHYNNSENKITRGKHKLSN